MDRREFLQVLAAGAASGLALNSKALFAKQVSGIYDLPSFGNNVTLLHLTDSHAQLLPIYLREASPNLGPGTTSPIVRGEALLKLLHVDRNSRTAYAFTNIDFERSARAYGKVGGYAHLATLVKHLREQRPGALLLDGGDSLQGSATSLWTKGQDMVEASKLLGVDAMTGHWEFTLGAERLKQIVERELQGSIDFIAQNVTTLDGGERVFKPYVLKETNGVLVGIIGQAYPFMSETHPRQLIPEWRFGIDEEELQNTVDEVIKKGAQVVVLLSHCGITIDLELAKQISGIDAILGGHSHDPLPSAIIVNNRSGYTIVTNAGSHGKFLGVLDLNVKKGAVTGYQYKLLPVFSDLLQPDKTMLALINKVRSPYSTQLNRKLGVTRDLLYRRDNFNGTFDQLILDAMLDVSKADIVLFPGFRWGATVLPKQPLTMEQLINQTAITYPNLVVADMSGNELKVTLEKSCHHLFASNPYQITGEDMLRIDGLQYSCDPAQDFGHRINNVTYKGKPIDTDRKYKVAHWGLDSGPGQPVWETVAAYLKKKKSLSPRKLNLPKLVGVPNLTDSVSSG